MNTLKKWWFWVVATMIVLVTYTVIKNNYFNVKELASVDKPANNTIPSTQEVGIPPEVLAAQPIKIDLKETEVKPSFPGGLKALYAYMSKEVKYPASAKEEMIQGTVKVKFQITREGLVRDVRVTQKLSPDCDKAVVLAVKKMPRWKPGNNAGYPVNVDYLLPFEFKLN